MNLFETFQTAWGNLAANKLRSGLTMLGVIIGVAAVVSMASIVEGGKQMTVEMMEKLGTNLFTVRPKKLTEEEMRAFPGRSKGLKYEDGMAIMASVAWVTHGTPVVSQRTTVRHHDRDWEGTIEGVLESYDAIQNYYVDRGRFLSRDDIRDFSRVTVLGKEIVAKLFPTGDPLDSDIKIGEHRFVVVGVLKEKGSLHGINYDVTVLIPATTAMKLFQGNSDINSFVVKVGERRNMKRTQEAMKALLMRRHDGVEDFSIRSQEELLRNMELIIFTFRVMLGGIALLSLLVGGIGIMNIMLVTVTERTAEIGLRKAVGATRRDIVKQFLIESVVISLVGGAVGAVGGIALGYAFGWLVSRAIPGWHAVILPGSILVGFLFAVAVGIFFGLYPAQKAARLDPAEALRYQ